MKAEVIAVGTELLLGEIPNTNSQFISQKLAGVGVDVLFHTSVGDNEDRLAGSISLGLRRNNAVILTGGLGPTHDDLTREAIAAATGLPLIHSDELESDLREWFEERGRQMAAINLKQCLLPRGAVPIPNPLGTAPGIELEHEGKLLFALPGVPSEMMAMLEDHVLSRLSKRSGGEVLVSRTVKVTGMPEADVAAKIEGTIKALDVPGSATIALLSSVGEVKIRISAKAESHHAAFIKIFQVDSRLKNTLGDAIFGADDDTLQSVVGDLARGRNLTLAVAESFTGGSLISRLIEVPDASQFVTSGYVAYSSEAKINELGVSKATLERHGAVSAETAAEMAQGARNRAGADIGLATTGEAGPEPQEKEVGTIFLGLAWKDGVTTRHHFVPSDRDSVTRFGTQSALNLLRLWLMGKVKAN